MGLGPEADRRVTAQYNTFTVTARKTAPVSWSSSRSFPSMIFCPTRTVIVKRGAPSLPRQRAAT